MRKRDSGSRAGNYGVGLSTPSRQLRRERAKENPEALCSPTALGTRADGTTTEGSGKVKYPNFFDQIRKKTQILIKNAVVVR